MNYYNPNRGPSGSPNPQKNSAGCLVAAVVVFLFALIVLFSVFDGDISVLIPFFFIVPVFIFIVVAIRSANKQQSSLGGQPRPYGRSPYDYAARPAVPQNNRPPAAPYYPPQSPQPSVNYDSHLCDQAVHSPESPRDQRTSLNQLQSGYGTQVARKDRKRPSHAYDVDNHNDGLKALVDAGLMTQDEYESMSRS